MIDSSRRRRTGWIAVVALWAAAGVLAMHGLTFAGVSSDGTDTDHSEHGAAGGGLGWCVFVLAGVGLLSAGVARRTSPPHRSHRRSPVHLANVAVVLHTRRRPYTWCVLRV